MKNFYTPFIYKDYHINIGGPNADHMFASMAYEDALPPPDVYSSYKTLRERNGLVNYIRSTFINIEEGEQINFDGGPNSLNSRLKLLELNPFYSNSYTSNPYYGIPSDKFLLYRSCYPISYDKKEANTQCIKGSVGMNVRVYKVTPEELQSNFEVYKNIYKKSISQNEIVINNKIENPLKYNVWRDLFYYEFIRNVINKEYHSPNFIQSYCYFLNKDANFNFNKNPSKINSKLSDMIDKSIINTAMIILTESPNKNIKTWASNIYVKDRNIQKQIYTGIKTTQVWESIISQILMVFYLMEEQKFTFEFMDLFKNFFIKEINLYGPSKDFWIYNLNGLDLYIPNYGYLLLVDHGYNDNEYNKYKIISSIMNDDKNYIIKKIRQNAKDCLSINNFSDEFKKEGGEKPPDEILFWLRNICKDLDDENLSIKNIIEKNLLKFVHNRVGTFIRELEKDFIKKIDIRPFRKGELVIYEEKYDTYIILIFIENISETKYKCLTKSFLNGSSNTIEYAEFNKDLIYHYSEYDKLRQDEKLGEAYFDLEYVIETYKL